jgi:hypothetical protein
MQSPKLSCSLSQTLLESYLINPHAVSRRALLHVCLLNVHPQDESQKKREGKIRCSPETILQPLPISLESFPINPHAVSKAASLHVCLLHVHPRDGCQKGREDEMQSLKLFCSLYQSLLESYPINPHVVSRPESLQVCSLHVDP